MAEGEPIKTLTWYCLSGCNGIGDRMKGIYAAFALALAMNRTFFIYQSELVQKQMLLEPNAINWMPINKCLSLDADSTLETFGQPAYFFDKTDIRSEIDRLESKQNVYISRYRSMAPLIKTIAQSSSLEKNSQVTQALLPFKSFSQINCMESVLHQFLFQVSGDVANVTATALENLDLHPQKFVSVHIRTGFMSTLFGDFTLSHAITDRFARTPKSWRSILDFALEKADNSLGNESLVYVATDDQEPKDWITRTYGSRIRTLNIRPVHVSATSWATDSEYFQNWVELSILAQSYAIVRTKGGFSDVASHICSINPQVYYTYEKTEDRFV